ncbi:DUF2637 domain-containing protein [Streptomyces sp. GSL17-111]|uniref:DUF2637 domain-containing protein n=1 Tax=Streptomyces sp. GSL17-111 TaxID=3121596 RepID=UPI0030F3BF0E
MKTLATLTPGQLKSIERTLSGGTWTITFGAVLFSVLTVTPLVQRVTPDEWDWTAPILPVVVDAAVVIVIRLDATVSRLGEHGGRWPAILRWLTGCMTLALNVGDSALKGDAVGVAVHAVAPLLLIVTAEAALAYRRAITRALDRIAREQREEAERERREHREREDRERAEREAREHREREERERAEAIRERREREEREHHERAERERREAAREQREWEAQQERERAERERAERREREDRERRDRQEREERERAEKERQEQEAREQEERERQERERQRQERKARREHSAGVRAQPSQPSANTSATAAANTASDKLPEVEARAAIVSGVAEGAGVRELARRTGWSLAWVSERTREARHEHPAGEASATELTGAGAR